MIQTFQTRLTKDLKNKRITVIREFEAPPEMVWRTWTESELLDQWWAPKPWMAKTKTLTFREGGNWLYAMVGPDGTEMWCMAEFISIKKYGSFKLVSYFCDKNGNKNTDSPIMNWKNVFQPSEAGTRVEVEINFDNEKDFQKIIDLGFEAGFTAGLGNLDELLAK